MRNIFLSFLLILGIFFSTSTFEERAFVDALNLTLETHPDWVKELNNLGIFSTQTADRSKVPQSNKHVPLFNAYPTLKNELFYVSLGDFPTPVHKLEKIEHLLGIEHLYIKRDDLSGAQEATGRLYGGNKVRKLEFLLAQALAYGAKSIITFGGVGSNHALATTVYSHVLGLKSICMLAYQPYSYTLRTNLLMHLLYGSELHYYSTRSMRKIGTLALWLDHYYRHGHFPYVIPTGGSSYLGAVGFVNAAFELKEQIKNNELPSPDYIYVPCGSMGTAAGLALGCKAAGLKTKIVAVAIEPEEKPGTFAAGITKLFGEINDFLYRADSSFGQHKLLPEDIEVNTRFGGTEYALFTREGAQAQTLLKATEDISLDGTYTAKACAAMLEDLKDPTLTSKVVLFWNTYCGLDFSKQLTQVDYKQLPECFNEYFEKPTQPLDSVMAPLLSKDIQ